MLLSVVFLSWQCQIYSVQLLIKNVSINNNGLNCFIIYIYSFFFYTTTTNKTWHLCPHFCHWVGHLIHFISDAMHLWWNVFSWTYLIKTLLPFPLINTKWFSCTKKTFSIRFICFQLLTLVGLLYSTFQHIHSQLVISAHNLFQ